MNKIINPLPKTTIEYLYALVRLTRSRDDGWVPKKIEKVVNSLNPPIYNFYQTFKEADLKYQNLKIMYKILLNNEILQEKTDPEKQNQKFVTFYDAKIRELTRKFMNILEQVCFTSNDILLRKRPLTRVQVKEKSPPEQISIPAQKYVIPQNSLIDEAKWMIDEWDYIKTLLDSSELDLWGLQTILNFNKRVNNCNQQIVDYIAEDGYLVEFFYSAFRETRRFLSFLKRRYPKFFDRILKLQSINRYLHEDPVKAMIILIEEFELKSIIDLNIVGEIGRRDLDDEESYYFLRNMFYLMGEQKFKLNFNLRSFLKTIIQNYFRGKKLIYTFGERNSAYDIFYRIQTFARESETELGKFVQEILTVDFLKDVFSHLETSYYRKLIWASALVEDVFDKNKKIFAQFIHYDKWIRGYDAELKKISSDGRNYSPENVTVIGDIIAEYWGTEKEKEFYSDQRISQLLDYFGSEFIFSTYIYNLTKIKNPDYHEDLKRKEYLKEAFLELEVAIYDWELNSFQDFLSNYNFYRRLERDTAKFYVELDDEFITKLKIQFIWNHNKYKSLEDVWQNLRRLDRGFNYLKIDRLKSLIKESQKIELIADSILFRLKELDLVKGGIEEILPLHEAKAKVIHWVRTNLNQDTNHYDFDFIISLKEIYKCKLFDFEFFPIIKDWCKQASQVIPSWIWRIIGYQVSENNSIEPFLHFTRPVKEYIFKNSNSDSIVYEAKMPLVQFLQIILYPSEFKKAQEFLDRLQAKRPEY